MANGLSEYLEAAHLDWLTKRTVHPTAPTTLYVSLHSADPGDTGASELASTGSYARASIATDTNNSTNTQFNAKAVSGTALRVTNKATVTFVTATANWNGGAAINYIGIWDAATTGNCLWSGTITGGVIVLSSNTLKFEDGDIVIQID